MHLNHLSFSYTWTPWNLILIPPLSSSSPLSVTATLHTPHFAVVFVTRREFSCGVTGLWLTPVAPRWHLQLQCQSALSNTHTRTTQKRTKQLRGSECETRASDNNLQLNLWPVSRSAVDPAFGPCSLLSCYRGPFPHPRPHRSPSLQQRANVTLLLDWLSLKYIFSSLVISNR